MVHHISAHTQAHSGDIVLRALSPERRARLRLQSRSVALRAPSQNCRFSAMPYARLRRLQALR